MTRTNEIEEHLLRLHVHELFIVLLSPVCWCNGWSFCTCRPDVVFVHVHKSDGQVEVETCEWG